MTTETTLIEATGVKKKKGEGRQDFLRRVWDAASDLATEDWEKLTNPAQEWVNACTKADTDGKALPDIPGAKADEPEKEKAPMATKAKAAAKAANGKANNNNKAKAKAKPEKSAKPAKTAKAPKDKAPKLRVFKEDGLKVRIKRAIFKNPSIGRDDLVSLLAKGSGEKISAVTVTGVRNELRHTIRLAQADNVDVRSLKL